MTYYKYAEREADSQVNWAAVSKGLSDTILKIDSDRQAKKAAIDEATREAQIELANGPKGENTTASAWTINYANDMMNYRLTINKLLKSGQMDLKDYQVATQNSTDATNLVFTIAQEYQDEYKAIMDRSRTIGKNGLPLSSVMELELAALNESYANLSNTVPTINSTNGMVYLSTPGTGKDGVQTLGDNYVSLQSLRNRMKAKVDMYDVKGISAAAVASLGENTISQLSRDKNFRRTGVVTTTTDATKLTQIWAEFTEKTAEDMITNPFAKVSILADAMGVNPKNGKAYTGVYNRAEWEADKTGNLILFENTNGTGPLVPVFTDQQTKDAKEFVKAGFSKYVDRKEDKRPFTEPERERPQQWEVEAANAAKDADNAQELWQEYFTATTITGKNAAKAGLLGTLAAEDAELEDIKFIDNDNIELIYSDPANNRPISMVDAGGNRLNGLQWAQAGTFVTGIKDVNKLRKYAKTVEGGMDLDKTQIAKGRAGKAPVIVPIPAAKRLATYLEKSLTTGMMNQKESVSVPQIMDIIGPLGFKGVESGADGSYITITAPDDTDRQFSLNDGPTESASIAKAIRGYVKSKLSTDDIAKFAEAGDFGDEATYGSDVPPRK